MRSVRVLTMIALAAAFMAAAPEDRTLFPYGEATTATSSADVIEGRVAAVDHASGRLVLDTDDGVVSLRTWPDEVANLAVGDRVRVSFVTNNGD